MTQQAEISRLEQTNALGLAYLRTMILLNGGGLLALLTYLGNASAQTAVSIPLTHIKFAMTCFLIGIVSIMVTLLVSYSFTATNPQTSYSQFWNRWIVLFNGGMALVCLISFCLSVVALLNGAESP